MQKPWQDDVLRFVDPGAHWLVLRWRTEEGQRRLIQLRERLAAGRQDWAEVLRGFGRDRPMGDGRMVVIQAGGGVIGDPNIKDLTGADLSNMLLQNIDFHEAMLDLCDLSDCQIRHCNLARANLTFSRLRRAMFMDVDLSQARLSGADLSNSYHLGSRMDGVGLLKADLSGATLDHPSLIGADLRLANLTNTMVADADIRDAKLDDVRFDADHNAMADLSESFIVNRRDRLLNWSHLRRIGEFPLFGVSWFALSFSLFYVNTVGFLNGTKVMQYINYPIPIPKRVSLLLVDSLLLTAGTTLFKLYCPRRVQEFSELQWVEQVGRGRLLYLISCWKNRGFQWPTLVLTVLGGVLGSYLVSEQLYRAARVLIGIAL